MEVKKKEYKRLYQVEGTKEKMELREVYEALRAKGYRGAKGPFWIAKWLSGRGHKLYEHYGNNRYVVGNF